MLHRVVAMKKHPPACAQLSPIFIPQSECKTALNSIISDEEVEDTNHTDNLLDTLNDEDNFLCIDNIQFHLGDLEQRRVSFSNKTDEILWLQKDDESSIRKVFLSIKVKRVSAIDNVEEQYRMRFDAELNWVLTESEYKSYIHYKDKNHGSTKDWEPRWYPHFEFTNLIETHHCQFARSNVFDVGIFKVNNFGDSSQNIDHITHKNKKINFEQMKVISCLLESDMTFAEELELQSFPFDCQDLTCLIREYSSCEFLPDLRKHKFASIDLSVSIIDEWDMESAMLEFGFSDDMEKVSFSRIVLRLKMRRKFFAILLNIITPMGFICGLALTSFSLHAEEELGDRLNLLITLIMTVIAFQYIVAEQLPNVSYLTYIDKYVLFSYLFLTAITVENAFGRVIGDDIDKTIFFQFCVTVFILYQISFGLYAIYLRKDELKKLTYNTEETEREVNFEKEVLDFDYKHAVHQPQPEKAMKYIFSVLGPDEHQTETSWSAFFNLF